MAIDTRRPSASSTIDTGSPLAPVPTKGRKGKWIATAILFLVVLPLALFALWVTIALSYSYSKGERAGFVQKLSQRGWVCKTYEGEMALANGPNVVPEIFRFSVRDPKVADAINNSLGRQVKLVYEQHKFVPTSCFGETEYFIKQVEPLGPATTASPVPGVPGPATALPPAAPSMPQAGPAPQGAPPQGVTPGGAPGARP
jgi:hypothetical protein